MGKVISAVLQIIRSFLTNYDRIFGKKKEAKRG